MSWTNVGFLCITASMMAVFADAFHLISNVGFFMLVKKSSFSSNPY